METSAPKRRKTSPTSSINLPAGTSQPNSDASGSSESGGTRRSSRLSRPSFLSPTKASLARSNPDVLARRNSRRSSSPSKQQLPAASDPGSPASDHGSESGLVAAQLEAESETGRLQDEAASDSRNAAAGRAVSPVRRAGGRLALKPKRTPSKSVPSPRPLPPPSAEEEELIDPFKRRGRLRRSPPPGVLPVIEPEEPELPPTPTQQGLSDPTSMISSPLGMNTPSKRPRRSKMLAERMKSSPLKQSPLRPPVLETSAGNEHENENEAGHDVFAPIPLTFDPLRNEPKRKKKKRKSHPGRKIEEEPDPLADKKALRDSLLAEIEKLQADRDVAERENERLYGLQYPGRSTSILPANEQQQSLVDVLGRFALPADEEAPPDPAQAWLNAAMDPLNSLPFGKGNMMSLPSFSMPTTEPSDSLPPPISHHPIPMTAEEELPYLQVLHPLVYTSTIANIPRDPTNNSEPIYQRHLISASSSPPGLFTASIEMVVNTRTLIITELSVLRLDPNAAGELKPFMDTITQGNVNSSLKRNINIMTWAMGDWLRVATQRAKFWHVVQAELGSQEGLRECAGNMRRHNRRRRKEEDDEGSHKLKSMSKGDMLALMGRMSFDLDLTSFSGDGDESLMARVQWSVKFDWTGEARSEIGLLMGVPAKWHEGDEKGSLTGIPGMFDKLLRESGDPMEALRTVVALVVGED
ncbi:hypothetical protein GGR57DRAFT_86581 [Xylariaceae sp. FL1272]|nr:hypothetical protein GGR57DRAFT_86581 [Xylariaceae sp. FL1272]